MEKVLCIPKNTLPISWQGQRIAIPMDLDEFVRNCSKTGFCFLNRDQAETNPDFKQIIPYIVLQTGDFSKTAVYQRQGSETRLHQLWSAGIGGHINPVDGDGLSDPFKDILYSGMERELSEEIDQRPETDQPAFAGVISEELTDVGKVHLGAVFRITTDSPEQYRPGKELFRFTWMDTRDLGRLSIELWSTLALELLGPY